MLELPQGWRRCGRQSLCVARPERAVEEERDRFLAVNQMQFLARTIDRGGGESRLLLKSSRRIGAWRRAGVERDSVEYRTSCSGKWQRRLSPPGNMGSPGIKRRAGEDRESDSTAYFAGVTPIGRSACTQASDAFVSGRLPTPAELAAVSTGEASGGWMPCSMVS
ncbi:MAG: hypothetical protein R3B96_07605 [Pirellulaceae bacterium]